MNKGMLPVCTIGRSQNIQPFNIVSSMHSTGLSYVPVFIIENCIIYCQSSLFLPRARASTSEKKTYSECRIPSYNVIVTCPVNDLSLVTVYYLSKHISQLRPFAQPPGVSYPAYSGISSEGCLESHQIRSSSGRWCPRRETVRHELSRQPFCATSFWNKDKLKHVYTTRSVTTKFIIFIIIAPPN